MHRRRKPVSCLRFNRAGYATALVAHIMIVSSPTSLRATRWAPRARVVGETLLEVNAPSSLPSLRSSSSSKDSLLSPHGATKLTGRFCEVAWIAGTTGYEARSCRPWRR
jgi:hypothetical protein